MEVKMVQMDPDNYQLRVQSVFLVQQNYQLDENYLELSHEVVNFRVRKPQSTDDTVKSR